MTIAPEIQAYLQVVLLAVFTAIGAELGRLARQLIVAAVENIKARLGNERYKLFVQIVEWAVQQAEQKAVIGLIDETANAKLDEAIYFIQGRLSEAGLTEFNAADVIRAGIEAAIARGAEGGPILSEVVIDASAQPAPAVINVGGMLRP